MFRILSGILTIGNLEFSTDDEGFTQQTTDEEKSRHNLNIIAVRIISEHATGIGLSILVVEHVRRQC